MSGNACCVALTDDELSAIEARAASGCYPGDLVPLAAQDVPRLLMEIVRLRHEIDDMSFAEVAARAKALEEAARVCDLRSMSARVGNRPHAATDLSLAAEAIRALAKEESR